MVTHKNHCVLHDYHGSPQEMDTLNYEALNKLAGTYNSKNVQEIILRSAESQFISI